MPRAATLPSMIRSSRLVRSTRPAAVILNASSSRRAYSEVAREDPVGPPYPLIRILSLKNGRATNTDLGVS